MREKGTREFIASLSLPTITEEKRPIRIGRWDSSELQRLVDAITQIGDCSRYGEIAALLGDRTQAQVAVKVSDLLKSGQLRRTDSSSYSIAHKNEAEYNIANERR